MSYSQFQAASDYLGAIADEDYVKALPSNSYEDRGGAVLDGPEAGYKVTYTQADAEAVTAEDGRVILMDEHLADSDAMDYDMDRADGEWALSDYVQKGIEVLDNDTGFFMMCEGGKIDWACHANDAGTKRKEFQYIPFGDDVMDDFTLSLLTNKELLVLLSEDFRGEQLRRSDGEADWKNTSTKTGMITAALFNLSDTDREICLNMEELSGQEPDKDSYEFTEL